MVMPRNLLGEGGRHLRQRAAGRHRTGVAEHRSTYSVPSTSVRAGAGGTNSKDGKRAAGHPGHRHPGEQGPRLLGEVGKRGVEVGGDSSAARGTSRGKRSIMTAKMGPCPPDVACFPRSASRPRHRGVHQNDDSGKSGWPGPPQADRRRPADARSQLPWRGSRFPCARPWPGRRTPGGGGSPTRADEPGFTLAGSSTATPRSRSRSAQGVGERRSPWRPPAPTSTSSRSRWRPGVADTPGPGRRGRPDERAAARRRRGLADGAPVERRQPGGPLDVLPRPVAQGAPPQSAASSGPVVRPPSPPPGSAPAPSGGWRPTGPTTLTRWSRSSTPSRCSGWPGPSGAERPVTQKSSSASGLAAGGDRRPPGTSGADRRAAVVRRTTSVGSTTLLGRPVPRGQRREDLLGGDPPCSRTGWATVVRSKIAAISWSSILITETSSGTCSGRAARAARRTPNHLFGRREDRGRSIGAGQLLGSAHPARHREG